MSIPRTIEIYDVNPRRDRQYDDRLLTHLAATWELPGRTANQIARAAGFKNPFVDKQYAMTILWALEAFAKDRASPIIVWYPHLRLSEATLKAKMEKSPKAGHDMKLYKHAPWRKMMDNEPMRADEIVQGVIEGYLRKFEPATGNGIHTALVTKLGHITRPAVARALKAMTGDGRLTFEHRSLKRATVYALSGITSVVPSVVQPVDP